MLHLINLYSTEDRFVMGKGPLMPVTSHDSATEIYNAASILSTRYQTVTAGHWGKAQYCYICELICNVVAFLIHTCMSGYFHWNSLFDEVSLPC